MSPKISAHHQDFCPFRPVELLLPYRLYSHLWAAVLCPSNLNEVDLSHYNLTKVDRSRTEVDS